MYINPQTNIRLLKNVPLDNTYQHTIYFDNPTAQANYFMGMYKYNLTNYTYQRVNKGVARVGIKADSLYDCNYMMFQNTAYGNKWFYAFITAVEYVNNECSEVTFELDVMQTWFFDHYTDYCFVEREHSETDNIGEHIEPESLATGEYVMNTYAPISIMNDMCVMIAIVDVSDETDGTLYDGIYGSASLYVYNSTDVQNINSKINEYIKKTNAILSIYMLPKLLIPEIPTDHKMSYGAKGLATTVTLPTVSSADTLNGYLPKNKKLYSYPYNFFHIDNANGSELTLRYEFFDNLTPVVQINGTITQPVTLTLRPVSYKGVAGYDPIGGYTTLNTESLTIDNYPLCSWNVDSFQAWIAQSAIPGVISGGANIAGSIAQSLLLGKSVSVAGIGASVISQATTLLAQGYQASIASDISKGTFNNGGGNVSAGKQQFYGGRCSVSKEFAKMIDDYFSMFGYAVRSLKVPNRASRPHWNYVKTIGATLTGSVPADDMRKLCSIYDNGITFWKDGREVGNYNLDNSPA